MSPFENPHEDPVPVARAAAVRAPAEMDRNTRERARALAMAERLREGFALSRFASRLARAKRR